MLKKENVLFLQENLSIVICNYVYIISDTKYINKWNIVYKKLCRYKLLSVNDCNCFLEKNQSSLKDPKIFYVAQKVSWKKNPQESGVYISLSVNIIFLNHI